MFELLLILINIQGVLLPFNSSVVLYYLLKVLFDENKEKTKLCSKGYLRIQIRIFSAEKSDLVLYKYFQLKDKGVFIKNL